MCARLIGSVVIFICEMPELPQPRVVRMEWVSKVPGFDSPNLGLSPRFTRYEGALPVHPHYGRRNLRAPRKFSERDRSLGRSSREERRGSDSSRGVLRKSAFICG